jgi:hypothetical protein
MRFEVLRAVETVQRFSGSKHGGRVDGFCNRILIYLSVKLVV